MILSFLIDVILTCRDWLIQFGAFNLKDEGDEEWTEKRIKEVKIHPKFEVNSKSAYYDVAILVLESPVQVSISPTFYLRLFCTKVLRKTFFVLTFHV